MKCEPISKLGGSSALRKSQDSANQRPPGRPGKRMNVSLQRWTRLDLSKLILYAFIIKMRSTLFEQTMPPVKQVPMQCNIDYRHYALLNAIIVIFCLLFHSSPNTSSKSSLRMPLLSHMLLKIPPSCHSLIGLSSSAIRP